MTVLGVGKLLKRIIFNELGEYICIDVYMRSLFGFYLYKNQKSRRILQMGPLKAHVAEVLEQTVRARFSALNIPAVTVVSTANMP